MQCLRKHKAGLAQSSDVFLLHCGNSSNSCVAGWARPSTADAARAGAQSTIIGCTSPRCPMASQSLRSARQHLASESIRGWRKVLRVFRLLLKDASRGVALPRRLVREMRGALNLYLRSGLLQRVATQCSAQCSPNCPHADNVILSNWLGGQGRQGHDHSVRARHIQVWVSSDASQHEASKAAKLQVWSNAKKRLC